MRANVWSDRLRKEEREGKMKELEEMNRYKRERNEVL